MEIIVLIGFILLFIFGSKFLKGVIESIGIFARGLGWIVGPIILVVIIIFVLIGFISSSF